MSLSNKVKSSTSKSVFENGKKKKWLFNYAMPKRSQIAHVIRNSNVSLLLLSTSQTDGVFAVRTVCMWGAVPGAETHILNKQLFIILGIYVCISYSLFIFL